MSVIEVPPCTQCGGRRVDEYTHYGCPDASSDHAHRHWVCVTCGFEFSTGSDAEGSFPPATKLGADSVAGSGALADS
jgi:hypothetical protein